jgi:hypothetical protein
MKDDAKVVLLIPNPEPGEFKVPAYVDKIVVTQIAGPKIDIGEHVAVVCDGYQQSDK